MQSASRYLATVALLTALLAGCGTPEYATDQRVPPPTIPPPYVVPDTVRPEPPLSFRIQSDTVATAGTPGAAPQGSTAESPDIRYMVQIGSFRNAANAAAIQARARERYGVPVVNDYNTITGLYQIRIGFFETREAALALRNRLAREFPEEYGDAWVVRLAP